MSEDKTPYSKEDYSDPVFSEVVIKLSIFEALILVIEVYKILKFLKLNPDTSKDLIRAFQRLNDQLNDHLNPKGKPAPVILVKPSSTSGMYKVKRPPLTEDQLLGVAANFMSDLQAHHLTDILSALIWYNDHLLGRPTGHIEESKLADIASIISMQGLDKRINPDDN